MDRNAIILAAGTSSRFVPLSAEIPKGLLEVKGEVLIERQIRQLKEAGIDDIVIVTGYKKEKFDYLRDSFDVDLVYNEDYSIYNNTSSMIRVLDRLGNSYICSSDNYFQKNVFLGNPKESYYSSLFAEGPTDEYCLTTDNNDNIIGVTVGGRDSWYMIGNVYFSEDFSKKFRKILETEYDKEEIRHGYWEDVYIRHLDKLPLMKISRFPESCIKEFDSIDELRRFDETYVENTRSAVVRAIAFRLDCKEGDLSDFCNVSHDGDFLNFSFLMGGRRYVFNEIDGSILAL
ncbi:MAG: NTP transferase domain-containing protein [Muribaculaceae bacterium]|nr:NTP transferase domain-containing protein [Muribaculaceae bacterium]